MRPIINVSGTMTALGASIMVPEAIEAMAAIAPQFLDMAELHQSASEEIVRATGAESGIVTASAAAGIIIAVAAAMTGPSLPAIKMLPLRAKGIKGDVVLQGGHDVDYGNSLTQAIRIAGGTPVVCGTSSAVTAAQIEDAITENTAAGLFVVAHTTARTGMVDLPTFARLCHVRDVPVIVDAASEYDLRRFLAEGADLVIYSGHKFLGGPTSGIIAGRRDLIEACRLQNSGLGRAMKVGKESIAGLIAALDAWTRRDHTGIRQSERAALDLWQASLAGTPGLEIKIVPDPTGNPLDRLEIRVLPKSGTTATALTKTLAAGSPSIVVRGHKVDEGVFWLDPCNLHPGQATIVAEALSDLAGRLR
ncbi:aminotransferase class V-fold PLP-dependent enzyme [Devosia aurantiaca]|uniref:Aminotransferase class V-fold PLP-dependent enzyme n=1 Tax=Devosia aurantiaca TaxID=2714858 RepID=A0A6M1S8Z7_9HYPH|nr:aminotransferase class V-fold PLP-dependent enzyme [Devosia aurantiaca]NGP16489.1 aminotransferase class V-fold PLP-dependent enzyme [Devosia aurantiaca]